MPILVRPVREQLEHDRVIRFLQAKLKRKYDVAANIGEEKIAPVRVGGTVMYPDLVIHSSERGRALVAVAEVETAESVNNLEAMAQWAHLGRARAPFHLYVPAGSVEMARRLCADHQVSVAELWSYHPIGDQIRFTLVQRAPRPAAERTRARKPAAAQGRGRQRRAAVPRRGARRPASGTKRSAAAAAPRAIRPQKRK
ncbi:MAG TPA: hypothetical protein VNI83_00105 [Vicinamibacterales bacterium]|nr:hypothetical protein [Vicinamibacterales bacterium]